MSKMIGPHRVVAYRQGKMDGWAVTDDQEDSFFYTREHARMRARELNAIARSPEQNDTEHEWSPVACINACKGTIESQAARISELEQCITDICERYAVYGCEAFASNGGPCGNKPVLVDSGGVLGFRFVCISHSLTGAVRFRSEDG